ncbi:hypothetical protein EJ04DRAFT_300226 [Polyplosphaeria fusca]|uniref:PARG catalytic Macro domain-containing protein n=1 Tax=Polyplosphaeria fusca TaxID=682080 RepID=A0A9P4UZX2_9PLEO|nr:hypothetical protein EJ04DRAFT_300226 [Polyplosphaeria fusca]
MQYLLPTHPSIRNNDPLGISDSENPLQADVLDTIISTALSRLYASNTPIEQTLRTVIEEIAYTIHGNGSIDTRFLQEQLTKEPGLAFSDSFPGLLNASRTLAEQFPTHTLEPLRAAGDTVTCSGSQINALLAHQYLGTLSQHEGVTWGRPDLTSWFAGDPAHPNALLAYLWTLLDLYATGGYATTDRFTFSMYTAAMMPDPSLCDRSPNVHLHTVAEESEPSAAVRPTFVLVAAHSQPGPGPTATQEERLQAASPALSTSALFVPIIPDDGAVVTSAFPVHSGWKGHNRTARLIELFEHGRQPRRHYILVDALELDVGEQPECGLKDLQPGRVQREVRKLYAAFSGAAFTHGQEQGEGSCVVEAGAWGCGAFGGNVFVKTVCMMIAAAMTGVELHLTLLESRKDDVAVVRSLLEMTWTGGELWRRATSPQASHADRPLHLFN